MKKTIATLLLCSVASTAVAEIMVPMHLVTDQGVGEKIGFITVSQTTHGIQLKPDLRELPPGMRGFHLHEKGSCDTAKKDGKVTPAGAAGGHYDPHKSGKHGAPWGDGHKGDLPGLYVNTSGTSTQPLAAPRLTLEDFYGRALVIHAGDDNYSDYPEPLGGGGARIACGVVSDVVSDVVSEPTSPDNEAANDADKAQPDVE